MAPDRRASLARTAGRPGPRSATTRRVQETRREHLMGRIEELILDRGFTSITMDEIAASVRASKSTLYALSPSKESLVAVVIGRFFEGITQMAEKQVEAVDSRRDCVAVYLSALGHGMRRMSRDCYDDVLTLPVTEAIYQAHSRAAAERVQEFIEAGTEANEFRVANARFIGRAVSLLMDGIQHGELITGTGLSTGEAYTELGSLILSALTARAPLDLPAEPYDPDRNVSEPPPRQKKLAYANLGVAEIFTVWGEHMKAAAERRGAAFVTANADFDSAVNVDHLRQFVRDEVGAILVSDLDAPSQRPAVVEAMEAGVAAFTVAFSPATTRIDTDQYASGLAAAEAMVERVRRDLGGEANVLMFNLDDREGIRPRYQAVRDVIAHAGSGVRIAVDQLGVPQTTEFGYETTRRILKAHPDVNVVIGEDAHVLGALAAIDEAGLRSDRRWLLVGIGGERRALEEVADPESPLEVDVAFALPLIGVVAGKFGADWLEGRNIPSRIVFNPVVLKDAEGITAFLEDMANPEDILGSPKRDRYLTLLGNVSYSSSVAPRSD